MSTPPLTPNPKHAIQVRYARQHALVRLESWPTEDEKDPTALLYLERRGRVAEILDSCEGPIIQAVENQERHDPHFDKLPDGSVDNILASCVQNKQIGVLQANTLGNPVFKPWGPRAADESNSKRKDLEYTVGNLSNEGKA